MNQTDPAELKAKALAFAATYREQFNELDSALTLIAAEYFRKVSDALYEIDNRESNRTRRGFVGRAPSPSYGALNWNADRTDEDQVAFTEIDYNYDDNTTIPWTMPWQAVSDLPGAVTARLEEVLEHRKKMAQDNVTLQKHARAKRIASLEAELAMLRAEQKEETP